MLTLEASHAVLSDSLRLDEKLGEYGGLIDPALLVGALIAAVLGVQNQAAVTAATADYETYSWSEAEAAEREEAMDGAGYSTVFEKYSKRDGKRDGGKGTWAGAGRGGRTSRSMPKSSFTGTSRSCLTSTQRAALPSDVTSRDQ